MSMRDVSGGSGCLGCFDLTARVEYAMFSSFTLIHEVWLRLGGQEAVDGNIPSLFTENEVLAVRE